MDGNYVPGNPFASMAQSQSVDLNKVNGIEGAKAFPTVKNSRYPLFDGNRDILYVKTTDSANYPSYEIFKLTKMSEEEFVQEDSPYATKQDMEMVKEMIKDVKQLISKLTENNNTNGGNTKRQEHSKQTEGR